MSNNHVQIVKDFFAAMGRGDEQGLLALSGPATGFGASSYRRTSGPPNSCSLIPFIVVFDIAFPSRTNKFGLNGAPLRSVVLGHVRYYGVPMTGPAIGAFRGAVGRVWWRVLRRRSQGNHLPWRRMAPLIATWLPPALICHPYPLVRLGVITQGGSRIR